MKAVAHGRFSVSDCLHSSSPQILNHFLCINFSVVRIYQKKMNSTQSTHVVIGETSADLLNTILNSISIFFGVVGSIFTLAMLPRVKAPRVGHGVPIKGALDPTTCLLLQSQSLCELLESLVLIVAVYHHRGYHPEWFALPGACHFYTVLRALQYSALAHSLVIAVLRFVSVFMSRRVRLSTLSLRTGIIILATAWLYGIALPIFGVSARLFSAHTLVNGGCVSFLPNSAETDAKLSSLLRQISHKFLPIVLIANLYIPLFLGFGLYVAIIIGVYRNHQRTQTASIEMQRLLAATTVPAVATNVAPAGTISTANLSATSIPAQAHSSIMEIVSGPSAEICRAPSPAHLSSTQTHAAIKKRQVALAVFGRRNRAIMAVAVAQMIQLLMQAPFSIYVIINARVPPAQALKNATTVEVMLYAALFNFPYAVTSILYFVSSQEMRTAYIAILQDLATEMMKVCK